MVSAQCGAYFELVSSLQAPRIGKCVFIEFPSICYVYTGDSLSLSLCVLHVRTNVYKYININFKFIKMLNVETSLLSLILTFLHGFTYI